MTIGAKQNALARLGSGPPQRTGRAVMAELKLLQARIQVMKLQHLLATVIAAEQAFASGLLHQYSLDRSPPLCHSFQSASFAAVVAAPLPDKHCRSVPLA